MRSAFVVAPAGQNVAHLRVLATTDLHMNILPYDYLQDRPANLPGLAHVARAVEWLRAQSPNTLLLDNGDFLQGSPMADYFALERGLREGDVHPMIAAMNALGFDAGTLGNHEFNYGLDFLLRAVRDARFALVSANLVAETGATPCADRPLVRPYAILNRTLRMANGGEAPLAIGVIGFAPPQTVQWDCATLAGRVKARDIVETARYWVPRLRAEGADLVIALAHTGIDSAPVDGMMQENAARALAGVPGIDALVLGHVHKVFPGPDFAGFDDIDAREGTIAGVPAVMGGHSGRHLGVIDLALERAENGGWSVLRARPRALGLCRPAKQPAPGAAPRPPVPARRVGASIADAHAETLAHIRAPLGETDAALHSYFSQLGPTPALLLTAAAQRAWFAAQPEARAVSDLPVLSAVAPFKAGGQAGPANFTHVAPGPLTRRHMHDLYPFPNRLAAVVLTGSELTAWLEAVAALYCPLGAGCRDARLVPPDAQAYNFDMIDGLEYRFDLSGRPSLRGLAYRGRPVAARDRFLVLTNSYRAAGGGGLCPELPASRHLPLRHTLNRAALEDHVAQLGRVRARHPGDTWRLTAAPGSTAVFDTAQAASTCLDDIAAYRPEPLGTTPEGFLRIRLNF
jgi:2',3'-cyclic-nucleotide 2'-phosphodiesterase/3'-nucleotidase